MVSGPLASVVLPSNIKKVSANLLSHSLISIELCMIPELCQLNSEYIKREIKNYSDYINNCLHSSNKQKQKDIIFISDTVHYL